MEPAAVSARWQRLANERGIALLLAIVLVTMLAAAGAAAALTARTETLISAGFQLGREALYAAEGGLVRAVHDLAARHDWSAPLAEHASASGGAPRTGNTLLPNGTVVVLCCDEDSLTADLQRRGNGRGSWGDDTPQWRMFAWGPAAAWLPAGRIQSRFYVVVWVADDVRDDDGNPAADANRVLLVHSLALGPQGSRRAVQAVIRRPQDAEGAYLPAGARLLSWHESRW